MKPAGFNSIHLLHPAHRSLLELLHTHRFATTIQLARLTQDLYKSQRSALRQTLRHLTLLQGHQFITALERRIGGWQGGSAATVWALTTKGARLLTGQRHRQRPQHISTTFLGHLLAITEVRVTVTETLRDLPETNATYTTEPECWRTYLGPFGQPLHLRPDLHLSVVSPQYTDTYFLEIDRATENPARVMKKCHQYEQYRRTGIEQRDDGIFPAVIWIVPHTARQESLVKRITTEVELPTGLFHVIVPSQIPALIRHGPPGSQAN